MTDKYKLRAKMALAGVSQNELADKIGMSKNTFSGKINGRGCFTTDQVNKICNVLQITDAGEKVEIFLA